MIRLLLACITLSFCWACTPSTSSPIPNLEVGQPSPTPTIYFSSDSIEVSGELGSFEVKLESEELEPGLELVSITLSSAQPATPPPFQLKWRFPSIDIHKYWNSNYNVDRVNFYYNNITSSASRLAPVMSFMDINDNNRFTFAVADALNNVSLKSELIEEDAHFHCEIKFFEKRSPATTKYQTQVLLDRRTLPYYQSLQKVSKWWAAQEGYSPLETPTVARRPMYSTWYSYHQSLDVAKVIHECREGKKIGMQAVIVDDGWQTLDSQRGYAYTGDWKPERIPEMKAFVDSIHALDMQFILWYSVPFIGKKAENFPRFQGKYLYEWESQGAWILDPRYPEVREFIIGTYENALLEWSLDGFKLDFMGFFSPQKNTVLTAENGRDFASVNKAVDQLMTDIMLRLKAHRPEIMIEFRQPYTGPLMRKYGNMFRASDCPNMATVNKQRVTDIRLLAGNSAVHSDMLMWHHDDPLEQTALQIQNILFSVPQISVRLDEIPSDHKAMITYWIGYWNANQKVLLDGAFEPQGPDALYPLISAEKDGKRITALYQDVFIRNEVAPAQMDIVNARRNTEVVFLNKADFGWYKYVVRNCLGEIGSSGRIQMKQGPVAINVPASGLLELVKESDT